MALAGIGKRQTASQQTVSHEATVRLNVSKRPTKKRKTQPLFDFSDNELPVPATQDSDPELAAALKASLEDMEATALQKALDISRTEARAAQQSSRKSAQTHIIEIDEDEDDNLYVPNRLETALAIANAGPTPSFTSPQKLQNSPSKVTLYGTTEKTQIRKSSQTQSLFLRSDSSSPPPSHPTGPLAKHANLSHHPLEVITPHSHSASSTTTSVPPALSSPVDLTISDDDMEEVVILETMLPRLPLQQPITLERRSTSPDLGFGKLVLLKPSSNSLPATAAVSPEASLDEDDDMEEVIVPSPRLSIELDEDRDLYESDPEIPGLHSPKMNKPLVRGLSVSQAEQTSDLPPLQRQPASPSLSEDEAVLLSWSRTPSPIPDEASAPAPNTPTPRHDRDFDAADEMNPQAEEGEYAQFLARVKGQDLSVVQREIDEEIRTLHKQSKAALRDSEDVTQQMVNQIMVMLRMFGIPYITAPMEAEAQCAALVDLGLVDGVITDDSDVFLFGGRRVYKNMFNQSKTVECFIAADLERELSLDRDKLVRLAYLLGSDYVDGLPGVGPVVAMELLEEFPGHDGLFRFREWWQKVQSGKDKPEESSSKFRRQFVRISFSSWCSRSNAYCV